MMRLQPTNQALVAMLKDRAASAAYLSCSWQELEDVQADWKAFGSTPPKAVLAPCILQALLAGERFVVCS
jgi:hypothetical protein